MPGDYGLMGYMQNINTAHRKRFTVQMAVQCTLCTEPPHVLYLSSQHNSQAKKTLLRGREGCKFISGI